TVEVKFELGEAPPEIDLNDTSIGWSIVENAASSPPRTVDVENGGGRTLEGLSAKVEYGDGPDDGWLQVDIGAAAPTELTATLATTALSPGEYEATINVESEQAINSPQSVDVSLTVAPRAVSIQLTGSDSPLESGAARTLTATLRDARGQVVTSGPQSTLEVTFERTDGSGSVTGRASGGVATLERSGAAAGSVAVGASAGTLESAALASDVTSGRPVSIELAGPDGPLASGAARTLTATVTDAAGNFVTDPVEV